MRHLQWAILLSLMASVCHAQKFYTYVGDVGTDFVLLSWGTTAGRVNTIGRASVPFGKATVKVGDRTTTADVNWAVVRDLQPDQEYDYDVSLHGKSIGQGKVRTWPVSSTRLRFFVMGDFGTGQRPQYRIADAIWSEFQKYQDTDNPVRFLLTTGDNIYGDLSLFLQFSRTGNDDRDWDRKFFQPYERILGRIPFYATLGNHDGNESESRGDLAVYLDNLFFPGGQPARYYQFNFGGLVDFFGLDSTENSESGSETPVFAPDGEQSRWLRKALAGSKAPWKIPYFHHPPFSAGPRHKPSAGELRHWLKLFGEHGVQAVFNGHEHNFQFSERNAPTQNILYVVTGSGGELRRGDVRTFMKPSEIAGWSAQNSFLSVEIDGPVMRITPLSYEPMVVRGRTGEELTMPIEVQQR